MAVDPAFTGQSARSYASGPPRQVPGFADLHRMSLLLLEESVPQDGHLLMLGAGGGLEMRALAEARPDWHIDGVDPSPDMLTLAAEVAGPHAARMRFLPGTIADAPPGPYDAALSLLTFHFIPRSERLETLCRLRARCRPGTPLILAHLSFAQTEPARSRWIARHVAFGAGKDADPARIKAAREAIASRLTILSPDEEEDLLAQAGFTDISLFYAGFGFRGWISYAA